MDEQQPPVHILNSPGPDRQLGTLAHILGPILGFLVPLILYATYDKGDELLKSHLIQATNASITFTIAAIIHSFLMIILIGCLTFPVHWALYLVWALNANSALKAGQEYQYPFTIQFISA